jgi:hypothetical protein
MVGALLSLFAKPFYFAFVPLNVTLVWDIKASKYKGNGTKPSPMASSSNPFLCNKQCTIHKRHPVYDPHDKYNLVYQYTWNWMGWHAMNKHQCHSANNSYMVNEILNLNNY